MADTVLRTAETSPPIRTAGKLAYGMGDLASTLVWGLVSTFLLYFYTDVALIAPAAVSVLFLTARLWDAVNDPIMGGLIDRTRSRHGRFRPYLLYVPIPLAIVTILTFIVPPFGMTGRIVYAYVSYILLGMLYTAVNIPYGAMLATMTRDPEDRSRLSAYRNFFAIAGSFVVAVATLPLVSLVGGGNEQSGFLLTVMMYSVVMIPLFWIVFRGTTERITPAEDETRPSAFDSLRSVFANRALAIVGLGALIVNTGMYARQSIAVFYFEHNVGNADLTSIFLAVTFITMFVGIFAATPVSSKLGSKRRTAILALTVAGASYIGMWVTGPEAIVMAFVWTAIGTSFFGMMIVMVWSMIADAIDYGEWKSGTRSDGFAYAAGSLMQKIGIAVGGSAPAFMLSLFGYTPGETQSSQALAGINFTMTVLPGILLLLAAGAFFWYPLNRVRFAEIAAELEARRIKPAPGSE